MTRRKIIDERSRLGTAGASPARLLAVAMLASTMLTPTVFAQSAGADADKVAATTESQIDDIIVTADRRETSLMALPMSVQVTSGEVLKDMHLTNVRDLTLVAPTFTVARSYQGTPQFSIRGISFNAVNMTSSPTVAVYQNDVAFVYPYLLKGPMYDMQRVEVLKGPQGTLYGRNTTAGLISLIPNGPTDTFKAGVSVDIGNYQTRNLEAYISGPITDTLRFRISGRIDDSGKGWQTFHGPSSVTARTSAFAAPAAAIYQVYGDPNRPDSDKTLGEVHDFSGRAMLSWNPTPALDIDLVGSMWKNTSDTQAAQGFALAPNVQSGITNSTSGNYVLPPLMNGIVNFGHGSVRDYNNVQSAPGVPLSVAPGTNWFNLTPWTNGRQAAWQSASQRCATKGPSIAATATTAAIPPIDQGLGMCGDLQEDSLFFGGSLKIGYQLSEEMRLTSITGYNNLDRQSLQDASGAPFELLIQNPKGKIETFSQELRLEGKLGDRVDWTLAGYYGKDTMRENVRSNIGQNASARTVTGFGSNPQAASGRVGDGWKDFVPPPFCSTPTVAGIVQNDACFRGLRDTADWKVNTKSISGSTNWAVTDTLKLTAGLRYTRDYTALNGCTRDVNGNAAAGANSGLLPIQNLRIGMTPATYVRTGECLTILQGVTVQKTNNGVPMTRIDGITGETVPVLGLVRGEASESLKEDNISWRLAANWRPTNALSFYASASQGYKSGVIPLNTSSNSSQFKPVRQERVLSYEAGGRWQFGNGGYASLGGFYYDYKDKQLYSIYIDATFGPLARIANVPKSHAYGIEGEFNLPVADGFSLYGSGTWLHTEVDEFIGVSQMEGAAGGFNLAAQGVPVDLSGSRFPYAPRWALNGGVRFEKPVGDYKLGGSVNYRWQSDTISSIVENNLNFVNTSFYEGTFPNTTQIVQNFDFTKLYSMKSYGLVSANIGFGPRDDRWEVSVWGRNITDTYYATAVVSNASLITRYTGEPRTYGATFRYNF